MDIKELKTVEVYYNLRPTQIDNHILWFTTGSNSFKKMRIVTIPYPKKKEPPYYRQNKWKNSAINCKKTIDKL